MHQAHRRRYRRGRTRQLSLIAADAVAVVTPLALAHVALDFPHRQGLALGPVLALAPIWLVTLHLYGLYPRFPRYVTTSTLNELPRLFHAALVASVLCWVLLALLGGTGLGVAMSLLGLMSLIIAPLTRSTARHALTRIVGPERVLLVGTGSTTSTVERALQDRSDTTIVGHLPLPGRWHRTSTSPNAPLRKLADVVVEERVDRVLLSTRELSDTAVGDFLHWSRSADVSLTVLPEHFDVIGVGSAIDQVQGATVISLQPPMLSRTARLIKRTLDVVGAAVGLFLLAPVMLAIAAAIKCDSTGSALFRQERIGRGGRPFLLLKFRTMVPDADAMTETLMADSSDPHWLQIENDPRITRIGRGLRATSLDELPQLWNVLVGNMSLVGPRPLSVRDDARVGGWARGRLDITPGLTGLWQVIGRKSVPFEEMVKLDYLYVNNCSLWGDVKLLILTLPAVIAGRGAR